MRMRVRVMRAWWPRMSKLLIARRLELGKMREGCAWSLRIASPREREVLRQGSAVYNRCTFEIRGKYSMFEIRCITSKCA